MKRMRKKIIILLFISVSLLLSGCSKPSVEDKTITITVAEFNKRGNVILNTNFDELKEKDIEPADIITVTIGETSYDIPVGTSYSDVDSGNMICRFDVEDGAVILAINGGSFAETSGMAVKQEITEDPGYRFDVKYDSVTFALKEKKGYIDEFTIRHLTRTNDREDYSNLSDADYANCRALNMSTIKENVLYRGSTPLDAFSSRDTYVMKFMQQQEIKTILNLTDTVEEMKAYVTYANSYYEDCNIYNLEMDYDFSNDTFASKVKECIIYMIENDGPFFIHCKEGKDRTGVFCAIIECYLGASLKEVKEDYMATYINFYHVEKDSETYNIIYNTNLNKVLCNIFEVTDLEKADLKNVAEKYLLKTGLTNTQLSSFTNKFVK